MPLFAVTFRIADDAGYDARYESVTAAIKGHCTGKYWDETTSFYLVNSDEKSSSALANAIDTDSTFSARRDLLVVINLSAKGYTALGAYADTDLDVLMAGR